MDKDKEKEIVEKVLKMIIPNLKNLLNSSFILLEQEIFSEGYAAGRNSAVPKSKVEEIIEEAFALGWTYRGGANSETKPEEYDLWLQELKDKLL